MAMILDAFVGKLVDALSSYVMEEVILILRVKDELQKLRQRMVNIQSLLKDAEKRKLDDSSVENWLAQLKDVLYDADDIIDLCRMEGAQLLADQNHASKPSPVCCGMSSPFPCFRSVPLHQAEDPNHSSKFPPNFFLGDEYVVGREIEYDANKLAELLLTEIVQEKCRIFAVTGMGGIGKTTLATKIFNHSKIQTEFQLKIWVCVSQIYSEIELQEGEKVLRDDAWSTTKLPEELRGPLYLSFTDLPSHFKQCFLYCSLYPEDALLDRPELSRLWVAEGFVAEQKDSLMEDLADDYFNELVRRYLLIPKPYNLRGDESKMHDLFRSLALFLSKDESICGEVSVKNFNTTLTKLLRLSVADNEVAAEILDSVADQGALRTLLASHANLTLNEERLRQLSHLRVLHIRETYIETLPDSIGNLVHLRYLDLDGTSITAIPESIERLANLEFLNICSCINLTELPNGITRLHNLRCLGHYDTPLNFIPKGIGKMQQLNDLSGFVVSNDNLSSKLEELNSPKKIRMLSIRGLERAQIGAMILRELSHLSDLMLFSPNLILSPSLEVKSRTGWRSSSMS